MMYQRIRKVPMMRLFNIKKDKNISKGFQIESPEVFVSWNINAEELKALLMGYGLKEVTKEYFTIDCTSLGGLKHKLGFHFQHQESGGLEILEFFRDSYPDYNQSFSEFQRCFEDYFGMPSEEYPINDEGFPSYEWKFQGGIKIYHYIMDRFGLEERLFIKKGQ